MIFERIASRFQFRFKDRVTAAHILGELVKNSLKREELKETVVLGIPRGGVITADILAKRVGAFRFDVIIPRKLTYPGNEEQAIGAIMGDGLTYIDQHFANDLMISSQYLEKEKSKQIQEIKRRSMLYLKEPKNNISSTVKDRTVIIVDDGAATGATIIAAAKWIRRVDAGPKNLIVAVPIAPKSTVNLLEKECGAEVKSLFSPSSAVFHSVEQYYKNFEQIPDDEVIRIIEKRGL
jgi:putative phosphoribosyl transferase